MTGSRREDHSVSAVNDYTQTADDYDSFRIPCGVGLLRRSVQKAALRRSKELHQMDIAAACCGTGAHEAAMCRSWSTAGTRFPSFILIDFFQEMLEQAQAKLAGASGFREAHRMDVRNDHFPLGEASVDWLSTIQCAHHWDHDGTFQNVGKVFATAFSALRPRGTFAFLSTYPLQSIHSRWYQLVGSFGDSPALAEEVDPGRVYADEYPTLDVVISQLLVAGFKIGPIRRIKGPYIDRRIYTEPERLLAEGQGSVSFFKMAHDRGLWDPYHEALKQMIANRRIEEVMKLSERWRKHIGVAYLINAVKPD